MEYLTREHISSALGVASIVAWLGAQAPQLYKNWCNSSVNGLALPFLVSWLFGDVTNLIGCLLTHQLPFQSWLATYFVIIDVGLMSQYIYYTSRNPLPSLPPLSASYPHLHPHQHSHSHTRASSYHHQTWESARKVSRKRKAKGGDQSGRGRKVTDGTTGTGTEEDPMMQSWTSSNPPTPTSSRPQTINMPLGFSSLPSTPMIGSSSSPTERGRTLTRPPPRTTTFFGHGLETISGSPASGSPGPLQQMQNVGEGPPPEWAMRHTSSNSRSRPPPPARRSSSMVFLSVGLLVGFGRWSAGGTSEVGGKAWGSSEQSGAVSGLRTTWTILQHPHVFVGPPQASIPALRRRQVFPLEVSVVESSKAGEAVPPPSPPKDDPDDHDPYPERNLERFFGRASAWVCTTLYLTSRLPQIWQNFRRRSVEGLSMLLFIMAFVGNSLYVLSILTNPLASYPGYLLEATPYLMGSGGTLLFDITIVLQGYFYSEPRSSARRRKMGKYIINAEEAAALLTADAEGYNEDTDQETAGRRSRSVSRPGERSRSSRRSSSLRRSDSTELAAAKSKSRWSMDPRGSLEDDRDFDFTRGEGTQRVKGTQSAGGSRSRTRPTSVIEAIPEEAESGVTIRTS